MSDNYKNSKDHKQTLEDNFKMNGGSIKGESNEIREDLVPSHKSIEFIINNLEEIITRFDQSTIKHASSLTESLDNLTKATYILNSLPEKIGDGLNKLVPDISEQLHAKILMDFDNALATSIQKLEKLDVKVDQIITKLERKTITKFKKTILVFVLNGVFLVMLASSTTYFMLQKFPTKVIISNSDSIQIKESDVTVWGRSMKSVDTKQSNKVVRNR